ncbi:glycosyltransferase [Patescibacteria group bacterium]|nr:glycosyltransferase [Patescibacteria group bacterium]
MNKYPQSKLIILSYGDILYENGYKTRLMGEMSLIQKYARYQKYLISFEKKDSYRRNQSRIKKLTKELSPQIKCHIFPRQNRWQFDFFRDINFFINLLQQKNLTAGIIHAQSLYACYMAIWAKQKFPHLKVIFDMHGLAAAESKVSNHNLLVGLANRYIEQICLHKSDHIITTSNGLLDYIKKNYINISPDQISVLPCLTTIKSSTDRPKLKLPTKQFIACYLGGVQPWQGLPDVVNFVKKHHLYLLCITNQPEHINPHLQPLAADQYQIISIAHDQVQDYLSLCDFGLLLRPADLLNQISFPTKFAEYLSAGLLVIHNGTIHDINQIITSNPKLGINISKKKFSKFLSLYKKNQAPYRQTTKKFAQQNLVWSKYKLKLHNIYQNLNKTKILYLLTTNFWGGAQKYVTDLAGHLDPDQYIVHVASGGEDNPGNRLRLTLDKNQITYFYLPRLIRRINPITNTLSIFDLIKLFKTHRYNIVHANSSMAGFVGRLAAKFTGIKKIYYTCHGWVFNEKIHFLRRSLFQSIEKIGAGWSTKIFCLSEADCQTALTNNISRQDKLSTIPLGVNIDQIQKQSQVTQPEHRKILKTINNWPKDKIIVGTIANFFPSKNLELFTKIAGQLIQTNPHYRFIIIGHGILFNQIKLQIHTQNLQKYFLLTKKLNNPYPILKLFDTFLLTSTKEGFPYTLLEAGVLRIPIVSTGLDGIKELITHQKTGFLVSSFDSTDFIPVINHVTKNLKLSRQNSDNLFQKIAKQHTLRQMIRKYCQIYEG